ncbi:MAG: SDR family oxidoreductase [Bacteroidetes bacterium]|nr:SDR family oxidoreductase [Bacteroidota bacterium]MBS1591254.1 SDR family oxidoreductase [Bacteroidota bacterium]MBS1641803.1 SDR family oxidoreductase [Bacteroidota bacterium]MBS1670749.1 SDR family oxidoreductase [Bacteroidota bacterium]
MSKLINKVAYITGGSKGIGLGIAKTLVAEGMKVAITGRDIAAVKKAAEIIDTSGTNVLAIQSNVSCLEDEIKAIQQTIKHFGQLNVVIANAGIGILKSIETLTAEEWKTTIDTNLTGVFNTVKASIDAIKQNQGYIITIASLAGTNFFEKGSAYNASKYGLVGFSQAIMLDLRKYGVKVTTIMPGSVTSYFNNHTPTEEDAWKIQPEDIGEMVVGLLKMHPRTLPSKIEVRPTTPKK